MVVLLLQAVLEVGVEGVVVMVMLLLGLCVQGAAPQYIKEEQEHQEQYQEKVMRMTIHWVVVTATNMMTNNQNPPVGLEDHHHQRLMCMICR